MTIRTACSIIPITNSSLPLMTLIAYPPDFLVRTRGNIPRGQLVIFNWVPFSSQRWVDGLEAVVVTYVSSRTVRTASSIIPITNSSLPLMAFIAYPPDFLVRTRGNIPWGQLVIFNWVPFSSQRWVDGLEAVVVTHSFSGTIRAASSTASVGYNSLPLMAFTAHPPDFLVRTRGNIPRGQLVIFNWVPFSSQRWVDGLEAVVITYVSSCTVRTAYSTASAINGSLPLMAFSAHPPDFLVRTRGNIPWGQLVIFNWVPFSSQRWVDGLEAVLVTHSFSGTIRAACSTGSSGYNSLPLMAFIAYPPDFLVRPRGNIPWGQPGIFNRVPFLSQSWICGKQIVISQTIVG